RLPGGTIPAVINKLYLMPLYRKILTYFMPKKWTFPGFPYLIKVTENGGDRESAAWVGKTVVAMPGHPRGFGEESLRRSSYPFRSFTLSPSRLRRLRRDALSARRQAFPRNFRRLPAQPVRSEGCLPGVTPRASPAP